MSMNDNKTRSVVLPIVVVVLFILAGSYFLFFTAKNDGTGMNNIGQMQELTQEVQNLESDVQSKETEVAALLETFKQKTGEDAIILTTGILSPDEQELLERRIGMEKDVSVKALLQDILKKRNEIHHLKARISEIEKLLPLPHIVEKGQNHYQIALNFLVNEKGVEEERAKKMVSRSALMDELAAGFRVWNFYTGDEFGTSVTQGTAKISPNMIKYLAKKKLLDARELAITERDKLAGDIKQLETSKEEMVAKVTQLTDEKDNLTETVSHLDRHVNSLFFILESQDNLKKLGILKSGFLRNARLDSLSPEYYRQSLDLRNREQLVISAKDLGMERLKGLTLYPKFYKKGTDYHVDITGDKKYLVLTLLDKDKFKNERVVFAVK
jgi:hypothetical protein